MPDEGREPPLPPAEFLRTVRVPVLPLGRGAAGTTVYRILALDGPGTVAVKQVPRASGHGDRELHGARLARTCSHENVARVSALYADVNYAYLVMPEATTNLEKLIRSLHANPSGGSEVVALSVEYARQLACALHYIHHEHSPPIAHRDIKPQNVLVYPPGPTTRKGVPHRLCLSDFGVACEVDERGNGVGPGSSTVAGTWAYLPPELEAASSRPPGCVPPDYDARKQDVYAWGLLVSQLATNCAPQTQGPGTRRDRLPPRLCSLVERCLDRQPERRPTAAELAGAFEGTEGSDLPTDLPLSPAASPRPPAPPPLIVPLPGHDSDDTTGYERFESEPRRPSAASAPAAAAAPARDSDASSSDGGSLHAAPAAPAQASVAELEACLQRLEVGIQSVQGPRIYLQDLLPLCGGIQAAVAYKDASDEAHAQAAAALAALLATPSPPSAAVAPPAPAPTDRDDGSGALRRLLQSNDVLLLSLQTELLAPAAAPSVHRKDCNICKKRIKGVRLRCNTCNPTGFDMCLECYARCSYPHVNGHELLVKVVSGGAYTAVPQDDWPEVRAAAEAIAAAAAPEADPSAVFAALLSSDVPPRPAAAALRFVRRACVGGSAYAAPPAPIQREFHFSPLEMARIACFALRHERGPGWGPPAPREPEDGALPGVAREAIAACGRLFAARGRDAHSVLLVEGATALALIARLRVTQAAAVAAAAAAASSPPHSPRASRSDPAGPPMLPPLSRNRSSRPGTPGACPIM